MRDPTSPSNRPLHDHRTHQPGVLDRLRVVREVAARERRLQGVGRRSLARSRPVLRGLVRRAKWKAASYSRVDVAANGPDGVRVVKRRDHPMCTSPSADEPARRANRAHLSPFLSLICTCVVGSFLSTSNWTAPLTGASGAFGLPIKPLNRRVEPDVAGAGEGAGLDSGKGEPEPRRLPEPVNGPEGCGAWRVHFSLRRSAMRSSTGWSCLTLRNEMGARLCERAVRSA